MHDEIRDDKTRDDITHDGETRDLDRIQRWMQSVIMHPGGVAQGMQSADARREIDVEPGELESVISPSEAQSSIERLEIYAHSYFARLVECLRAEFPMMVLAIGEDVFDDFAIDYLERYPSQSYTLNRLGAHFAEYLAETRPADGADSGAWPDFLVDLAALEWHTSEVFDGPGVENQPLLDAEQLRSIPPARWPAARLTPVPCLRLVRFDYPVHDYYRELRAETDPPPPEPAETFLALTRRDYIVRHCPLAQPEYDLLSSLVAGEPVGQAVARLATSQRDFGELAGKLQDWFTRWAAEGFFLSVAD